VERPIKSVVKLDVILVHLLKHVWTQNQNNLTAQQLND